MASVNSLVSQKLVILMWRLATIAGFTFYGSLPDEKGIGMSIPDRRDPQALNWTFDN